MNMKAMFFAGGGLMLSMVLTTVWISNDMQRIQERAAAKKRAACAALAASGQPTANDMMAANSGAGAAQAVTADECIDRQAAADGRAQQAQQQIDPQTGELRETGVDEQWNQQQPSESAYPAAGNAPADSYNYDGAGAAAAPDDTYGDATPFPDAGPADPALSGASAGQ